MFLIVDKPIAITSFGVIKFLKKFYIWQKIWHSGTLDPNATWLMILAVWKDTKNLEKLIWHDKTYNATIDFSKISDTRDLDFHKEFIQFKCSKKWLVLNEKDFKFMKKNWNISKLKYFWLFLKFYLFKFLRKPFVVYAPDMEQLNAKLNRIIPYKQLPLPAFSAKKVKWKRLYKMARKWKIKKRFKKMKVNSYEILEYNFPILKLKFDVGSGTYIRSIAYRLGKQFNMWWILTDLRRLSIWKFQLSDYKMKSIEKSNIKFFELENI